MINTKNVMTTALHTIRAGKTMKEAYALMVEHKIRHLPVMNEQNFVVGMLSDRDMQLAMTAKKETAFHKSISLDETLIVDDFMSWPVYVVAENTSIRRVAEEMLAQKVSAFLIEDTKGKLKGIITTDDLLELFVQGSPILPDTSINFFTKRLFK